MGRARRRAASLAATLAASGVAHADAGICVPMRNHGGTVYTIPMGIGTPLQSLRGVADSGSYSLVAGSTECKDEGCKSHALYAPSKSDTFFKVSNKTFLIRYGSGSLTVDDEKDVVAFEDNSGAALMKPTNTSVGLMKKESLQGFGSAPYDGIIGMGKNNLTDLGETAFLSHMGVWSFTVCLGNAYINNGLGGRLHLSERLEAEGLQYVELQTGGVNAWVSSLEHFQIGDTVVAGPCRSSTTGGCGAIIDSGTTLLTMPVSIDKSLRRAIDARCAAANTTSGGSCLSTLLERETCSGVEYDGLPEVQLLLGGQHLRLRPEHYMGVMEVNVAKSRRKTLANGLTVVEQDILPGIRCIPLFSGLNEPTDYGPLVILGLPFLRAHATHFDRTSGGISVAGLPPGSTLCDSCPNAEPPAAEADSGGGAGSGQLLEHGSTRERTHRPSGGVLQPSTPADKDESTEIGEPISGGGPAVEALLPIKMSELRWPTLAGVRRVFSESEGNATDHVSASDSSQSGSGMLVL